MREPAPEVEAPAYVETFGEQLGDGVRDFLARQPFVLPSPFLSWRTPNSFTNAALASAGAPGGRALATKLRDLLHPDELVELVNRGRKKGTVQVTDEKTTWTEERTNAGPANWYPDVAIEIGQIMAQRFLESLGRMAPRYLDARVAAGVQAEAEHQASIRSAPEPSGALLTSDPLDVLTANSLRGTALTGGGVLFDWPGYHMANPQAVGHAGGPRPVTFTVEPAQNGTHWVRVTSPADPLPEEVALALFGATTKTPLIGVAAPPLFGFGDASSLRPEVQAEFTAAGVDTRGTGDPAAEGLKGPLADEIALGQAKAPAGATKQAALASINESLVVLDKFSGIGAGFGLGKDPTLGDVKQVRARLVAKQTALATAGDSEAAKWAGQASEQRRILSSASFGFAALVDRFESMTKLVKDATEKLGGFNLPAHVRDAMHSVAMQYVEVAALSFFPATADVKLQAADLASRMLPVKILEGTLAGIQRTVDDALTDKRKEDSSHASYDTEGMQRREIELRQRLAAVRVKLLGDPASAGEELAKLQQEILDLQTETEIVGNMDQLDAAWQALDDSISFWFTTMPTRVRIDILKGQANYWHGRWQRIFDLWKKGDKASRDQATNLLEDLRHDDKLPVFFGELKSVIKDAQVEAFIGKIVALLVISVVTFGVGEFVAGWAVGAELAAGARLAAVGASTSVTFTVLNQIFIDTDHSAGHIAWELATNFAMFWGLSKFTAFAEAAKLSKISAATSQAVLLGAMGLAKEEIAKYAKTGKHLTRAEVGEIALQSLIMFVALNGVGKLAEPIMKNIKAEGTMLGLRRNAANRAGEGLKTMQAALAGSKDPAQALAYIEAERNWLQLKVKAYEELELAAAADEKATKAGKPPKDGGVLKQSGMSLKDVAGMKASLGKHLETMTAAKGMLTLEPLTPATAKDGGTWGAPRSRIADVLKDLGGGTLAHTDPNTTVRTYEAKGPDGKPVTIVERLDTYDQFLVEVGKSLDATELAKWQKMTGSRAPKDVFEQYKGDKDVAIKAVQKDVAKVKASADTKTASAARMAELRLKIADNKIMTDPRAVEIVDSLATKKRATVVSELRDYVMAKITGEEALARAQKTDPNAKVLTGVKVYERIGTERSVAEYKTNHPEDTSQGLIAREDGVYRQRREIDVMVIVPQEGAPAKISHREEIKTGTTDTNADALDQLNEIGGHLAKGEAGGIRLELNGKNITPEIDLASDSSATKATRGPSDKGFDESLGITAADLERLVKSLVDAATVKPTDGKESK
jgi:hypothetical protein